MVVFTMKQGKMKFILCLIVAVSCFTETADGETIGDKQSDQDLNELAERQNVIKVNKCCEKNEVMVDKRCTHISETNTSM